MTRVDLALALSACIGLEWEIRQKNAGLRTHTWSGNARKISLQPAGPSSREGA